LRRRSENSSSTLKERVGKQEEERVAWRQEKNSLESKVSRLSALLEKNQALYAAADERAEDFRRKALNLDTMLESGREWSIRAPAWLPVVS
jgi:hypothetical protein